MKRTFIAVITLTALVAVSTLLSKLTGLDLEVIYLAMVAGLSASNFSYVIKPLKEEV